VVSLPPEIADSPRARATFERAAAEASRVTGLTTSLGADGPVRVVIDPEPFFNRPKTCAFARTYVVGEPRARGFLSNLPTPYPSMAFLLNEGGEGEAVLSVSHLC